LESSSQTSESGPLGTAPDAPAQASSLGVPSGLLIGAIALLVVLVSLPRFHAHAMDANRADARITLDVLGAMAFSEEHAADLVPQSGPEALTRLLRETPALTHRFPDARVSEDTGQFLHHGYRVDTGFVLDGIESWPALVSWPDRFTDTGDAAFALTADGRMYGHPNRGLWSGGQSALRSVDLSDEGWKLLRPARPE
jgi:hypothetical protein